MIVSAHASNSLSEWMEKEQNVIRNLYFGEEGGILLPELVHGTGMILKEVAKAPWPVCSELLTPDVLEQSLQNRVMQPLKPDGVN